MKEKLENFFYYYKFHLLAAAFVIFVVVLLVRENKVSEYQFVIVDHSSALNMESANMLLEDFTKQTDLKKDEAAFQYRSMYLEEKNFKDISFGVAGITGYEDCFSDGTIDMVICTANLLEGTSFVERDEVAEKERTDNESFGTGEEGLDKEESDTQEETQIAYTGSQKICFLDEYFTKDELKKYESYIYYAADKPVGIIFDKCDKAQEYFGDNYPTHYHYILQITESGKENPYVKEFLEFLLP